MEPAQVSSAVAATPVPTSAPLPRRRVAPRSAPSSASSSSSPSRGQCRGHSLRPSVVFSAPRLHVTVGGSGAFYAAELTCAPEHAVTVAPSNLPTSLRVAPSLHVFTRENWSTPQVFRVAAVGSTALDDTHGGAARTGASGTVARDAAPRAFVQVLEHTSSSLDARFHGARLLFLPGTIVVHVSPRDGAFVFATGRALATAAQLSKGSAAAAHHGYRQLQVDGGSGGSAIGGTGGSRGSVLAVHVARSSMVASGAPSPGNAAPIAAVDAANSAVARRLTAAQRSVVAGDDTATVASARPPLGDAAQSFVKVAGRKLQTVLLHRHGAVVALGKRERAPGSGGSASGGGASGASGASAAAASASDAASDAALAKMLTDVDCGDDHVVALTEHGYLLTWGDPRDGRLGHGTEAVSATGSASVPRLLRALLHKRVVQVACGARHALALAEDGDVFAWGYGRSGALGLATSAQSKAPAESVSTPMEVLTLKQKGVVALACGDLHSAALLANGALLTCGWAAHGRLGRELAPTSELSGCFARVDLRGRLCTFVACGGAHTLALTACHAVLAFGANGSGQLGVGDCRHRRAPTRVAYFDDVGSGDGSGEPLVVASVACGAAHSLAVTQDARVLAWGSDEFGQCGVGAFPQLYTVPHLVASAVGLGATQAACGDAHSVLLAHTSPRQLEALEAAHPARFAQLADRYERLVREDAQRRRAVLLHAKQREDAHDAAVRQRAPTIDPALPRGPAWQRQLQAAAVQAHVIAESATPVHAATTSAAAARRPQTANASLATALAKDKLSREGRATPRPSTGLARGRGSAGQLPRPGTGKVRCSSAALWRQTRLHTFEPPEKPESPTTASRPPSRSGLPLKLTSQARQTLGRIFHGDAMPVAAAGVKPKAVTEDNQRGAAEAASVAAAFSAMRPKSAPSRAVPTAATRAS